MPGLFVNSLWPDDAICCDASLSSLVQDLLWRKFPFMSNPGRSQWPSCMWPHCPVIHGRSAIPCRCFLCIIKPEVQWLWYLHLTWAGGLCPRWWNSIKYVSPIKEFFLDVCYTTRWLTPVLWIWFKKLKDTFAFSIISQHWDGTIHAQPVVVKSVVLEDTDPFILHIQYHGCWCPGDARSQGINSHGIDLVILESSVSTPKGLKFIMRRIDALLEVSAINLVVTLVEDNSKLTLLLWFRTFMWGKNRIVYFCWGLLIMLFCAHIPLCSYCHSNSQTNRQSFASLASSLFWPHILV